MVEASVSPIMVALKLVPLNKWSTAGLFTQIVVTDIPIMTPRKRVLEFIFE